MRLYLVERFQAPERGIGIAIGAPRHLIGRRQFPNRPGPRLAIGPPRSDSSAVRVQQRATPHRRPPGINKFQEFLLRRWSEGCHNATKLWHEIQDQGYTGGRSTTAKFIATLRVPGNTYFRTTAAPRQKEAKPPSPRQAAMLLARRPEKLKPAEQLLLAKLNECCPEIIWN